MHAHRGQAFQGVTPSFHLSNYQLSKQRYFVVCPLTFYRQRTSRTDLKSVRAAAETHGGTVTLHWENEWFTLRVLLPQKNEL